MVEAARHAHPARGARRALAAGGVSLALVLAPRPIHAEPSPSETTADARSAEPTSTVETPAKDEVVDPPNARAEDEPPAESVDDQPVDDQPTDDESTDDQPPTIKAEPLRPMQSAAWWTMFGAFAIGTTAGVLAGLSERQEDRATRLSTLFDTSTGAQPLYADRKDEYEQYLRRGRGYAQAAIGVGVVSGLATITAITLFAIDTRRQRNEHAPDSPRRARIRPRLGGMEVRF